MRSSFLLLASTLLSISSSANSAALEKLDEEVKRGQQQVAHVQSGAMQAQGALVLESAIEKGKAASLRLQSEIQQQKVVSDRLRAEKERLEKVQTVLTSGLLGALATTFVALLSLLTNFKRSRADRDFRRLEVIEKARQLEADGVGIPEDIKGNYFSGNGARRHGG